MKVKWIAVLAQLLLAVAAVFADIGPRPIVHHRLRRIGYEICVDGPMHSTVCVDNPMHSNAWLLISVLSLIAGLMIVAGLRSNKVRVASKRALTNALHLFVISVRAFILMIGSLVASGIVGAITNSGVVFVVSLTLFFIGFVCLGVRNVRKAKLKFGNSVVMQHSVGLMIALSILFECAVISFVIYDFGKNNPYNCPEIYDDAPGWKYDDSISEGEKLELIDRFMRVKYKIQEAVDKSGLVGYPSRESKVETLAKVLMGNRDLLERCKGIPIEFMIDGVKFNSVEISPIQFEKFRRDWIIPTKY